MVKRALSVTVEEELISCLDKEAIYYKKTRSEIANERLKISYETEPCAN